MGGFLINCPLCCDKTFNSKQSLIEHLANILENVYCPVCNNKWTSVVHLIEHLSLDNCQPDNGSYTQTIIIEENIQTNIEDRAVTQNSDLKAYQDDNTIQSNSETNFSPIQTYSAHIDTSDVNNMYVELLDKQPCIQTQELKLVKENGESRYMIMTQEDMELNGETTIVTKQNNDGTISLTAVEDMKLEPNGALATEGDVDDGQEIYSCNTCKVSFSSVIDHIQNYHNDQDVVVEEPIEDETDTVPLEYDTVEPDEPITSDKQPPRRVITDTGDIVEEPLVLKPIESLVQQGNTNTLAQGKEVKDKAGRVYTRRYVQVENLCDSIVRDIKKEGPQDRQRTKQSDQRGTTTEAKCHKVVVKEVQGEDGPVKIYNCLACDITAGHLNDFKDQPCKILKYTCPHCPVAYDNSKSLCAHMKVHKAKTVDNLYGCAICCTMFPSNKSLKLHKRMHDPIKSRPIDPPVENTDGSSVSAGRYLCAECDKMIPVDYRAVHAASHRAGDRINCSVCNKKFTSHEYLEMHMNVHNMDKVTVNKQDKSLPYHCSYCHRRFARPHEKVKHERIHTGEKPHSCEICGKSFRVSYCLTLHMRTHTGARPYACNHCGKRFKAHSVYNHHLLTHSEVRAYKCPYCPKAFKTSVQLAGHKNSHTKPFSCQHCNRPFASLYAVRVHTETHARQNNLKFSCALCGASYARAFALKDHVKQVHNRDLDSIHNLPTQDDDWSIKEKTEAEEIQNLNKDLQEEITDLGMNSNELIVP